MLATAFSASKGRRVLYEKKKNYSVIFSLTNFPAANSRANTHTRVRLNKACFREAVMTKLAVVRCRCCTEAQPFPGSQPSTVSPGGTQPLRRQPQEHAAALPAARPLTVAHPPLSTPAASEGESGPNRSVNFAPPTPFPGKRRSSVCYPLSYTSQR